ncbi:MAG: chemotaxis response regulator protein-glutamate methylesterase [Clostridiales bacterium]|nr:chemotaxis response regulator protein-glutamate methylesterase [Clostridiales bacterium]
MTKLHPTIPEKHKVRVLVLDDSLLFREIIKKGLGGDSQIEIVGFAGNPFDAKDMIPELKPDVLTLDIEMPRMDGIKFLRRLMPQYPVRVVVVTSLSASVFEAIDAGAVDFISKPGNLNEDLTRFFTDLKEKILAASQARFTYQRHADEGILLEADGVHGIIDPRDIIAIGASTGGTDAIGSIITKFSSNMPGIVIVQHMPAGFTELYAKRLDTMSNLSVKEAADGDPVLPSRVLVAPGDLHMTVEQSGVGYCVRCEKGEKVGGHRPSVDELFRSVAEAAGPHSLGVILTGMGKDGTAGLKAIREAGGYTIGQDEHTSVVYGMPMVAYMSGAVMKQLPLYQIPDEIIRKLSSD